MKKIVILNNTLFMLDENNSVIYNTQLVQETEIDDLVKKLTSSFSDVDIVTQAEFCKHPEIIQQCIKFTSSGEAIDHCMSMLEEELAVIPSLTAREMKYIRTTVLSILSVVSPPETVPAMNSETNDIDFYTLVATLIKNAVINKIVKEVDISGRFSI